MLLANNAKVATTSAEPATYHFRFFFGPWASGSVIADSVGYDQPVRLPDQACACERLAVWTDLDLWRIEAEAEVEQPQPTEQKGKADGNGHHQPGCGAPGGQRSPDYPCQRGGFGLDAGPFVVKVRVSAAYHPESAPLGHVASLQVADVWFVRLPLIGAALCATLPLVVLGEQVVASGVVGRGYAAYRHWCCPVLEL